MDLLTYIMGENNCDIGFAMLLILICQSMYNGKFEIKDDDTMV